MPHSFGSGSPIEDFSLGGNAYFTFTFGVAFSIFGFNLKFIGTPNAGGSLGMSKTRSTFRDINGDGLPDLLSETSSGIGAKLNTTDKTHLLKKVHTPLGGSWEVDYQRIGNTYDMPQSKWVLNKVETNDGFNGDSAFGPNNTLTEVSYENPKYDRRERSFFGFEKVTVAQKDVTQSGNPTYRYSETEYHNDNYYLKGAPKSVKTFDGTGNILSSKETKYNLLNPDAPQVDLNANLSTFYIESTLATTNNPETLIDKSRLFVVPVKTINRNYENSQYIESIEEFLKYSEFGNLEVYTNYGEGGDDIYTTEINYHPMINNTGIDINNDEYCPGYPSMVRVLKGVSGTGTLMRERSAEYNQGKIIEVRTKLNGNDENTINFEYDILGNLTKVIAQDSKEDYGNPSSPSFTKDITYDTEVKTYPIKVENSFGEFSEMEYNYLFGVPVLTKEVNNNKIRTRIDDRGRVIEISEPIQGNHSFGEDNWIIRMEYKGEDPLEGTIGTNTSSYLFNAKGSFEANIPYSLAVSNNNEHYAVTRHLEKKLDYNYPWSSNFNLQNELLTISIVDGLGKGIQVKKTHQYSTNNTLGWQVSGKNKVDAFGRVIESYLPTIQSPNNIINPTGTDLEYDNSIPPSIYPPLEMKYDEKDRKTAITQPGETTAATLLYEVENGMLKQTLINEAGQTNSTYIDNRGRKRKTVQNDEITTTFDYNAINELVKVTNTMGYVTNSIYDMAGRRTEIQHPDQGVTKLKYDTAGNLIERESSNLLAGENPGKITYDYTYNRLLGINYPNNPENNVRYVYGDDGTSGVNYAENSIGRVVVQKDASGLQYFQYDKLGNVIEVSRVVNVAGRRGVWFRTRWTYDSWSRVHEIQYPDDEEVKYYYNDAGKLYKVTSDVKNSGLHNTVEIVSNIYYNQFGERERIEYANGTFTNYDYDIRRRLDEVEHTFSGGNQNIKKLYTYDVLSNITDITTSNPGNTLPGLGQLGGPGEHHYTYDNYNRLMAAYGLYVGPNDGNLGSNDFLAQEYTLQMEYDKSHNIISKTQQHYYDGVPSYYYLDPNTASLNKPNSYGLSYQEYAQGAYVAGDNYGYVQPHAPRRIVEMPDGGYDPNTNDGDPNIKHKTIEYDHNGNQTIIKQELVRDEEEIVLREHLWDEENRLTAVDLDPENEHMHPVAVYVYDANGERIIKYNEDRIDAYSNAEDRQLADRRNIMIYPSGLVVAKVLPPAENPEEGPNPLLKYTNYYYIGSERVGSRLGTSQEMLGYNRWHGLLYIDVYDQTQSMLITEYADLFLMGDASLIVTKAYQKFGLSKSLPSATGTDVPASIPSHGGTPSYPAHIDDISDHDLTNVERFYFHPDHLGSSSYITNLAGDVTQHMEYLPFGELLVDEHQNSNNTPFKFNGKEFDEETGNYYYGARYYNPKWSIWLSVDPLAEKYPNWSPFVYVHNNPVNLIDPTGMEAESSGNGCGCPPDCTFWDRLKSIFTGDFLGINGQQMVEDANTLAASGGVTNEESLQASNRLASQSKRVEKVSQAAQEGIQVMEELHPYGTEAMLLTHIMMEDYEGAGNYSIENSPYLLIGSLPLIPSGPLKVALKAGPAKLTQNALLHILDRHAYNSIAEGAGKFSKGTSLKQLLNLINTTTTEGAFRLNTRGRPGVIAEYNFGRVIGTNINGNSATNLRVVISPKGEVITAFPF
ncbi:RHS repeat-associated core domain-containing protein [Mesonia sp. K7]|uniref:RHS repeat-associated core domain-containing protein n=1 Tax=Mesonia sp. K7 TaxID=2218606 RepID=UPI00272D4965|nr:RHS repeat-associated core domain-containing protein [Mesonia sp. K7]